MKQYNPDKVSFKINRRTIKGYSGNKPIEFGKAPDSGRHLRIIGTDKKTGERREVMMHFESSQARARMIRMIEKSKNKNFTAEDKVKGHKIELEKITTEVF